MRALSLKLAMLTTICLCLIPAAQAVEFEWQDSAGKTHSVADYKGKPMILHFWASWCPPCRKEMPGLEAWIKAHPEVQIAAITLDNRITDATNFLKSQHISLPTLKGDMSAASRLGVRGLPATLILDANGDIQHSRIGALRWDDKKTSDDILATLK
ncbi:MAG: TlpA disulfide reductase family protein [Mariprofundaceae bacterium]